MSSTSSRIQSASRRRGSRRAASVRRLWLAAVVLAVGACNSDRGEDGNSEAVIAAVAARSVPLDSGAIRQPIPDGIDPAMVEWRSDGVLIASQDSLVTTPGYVVDSIFPPEEALRRFQAETAPVTALSGGASSVDELMRRYWETLRSGDSLALRPYVVSKAEFAYLYFPESNEAANGLQPNVSWLLYSNNGGRGLSRALTLASTEAQPLSGTACLDRTQALGKNTVHGPCGIVRMLGSRPDTVWIAQHIIERDGVFKLLSFANEL